MSPRSAVARAARGRGNASSVTPDADRPADPSADGPADEPSDRAADRRALEAALLRELASTCAELLHNHFRGALRPPALALSDTARRLGAWERATRTISLSRALVFQQPWGAVREVLKHELAHQYVDEVLRIHDETAHGPAFAEVCRARGIDASAAGLPTGADGGASPNPILRRVMRLLALAGSANVHEAEAATNEARRLMLLHNVDAAVSVAAGGFSFRHVGPVKARSDASARILAGILGQHFFVSVIWVPSFVAATGRRGHVLELCGTAANLDVATYVHGFLGDTAERLWRAHKAARGIRSDHERRRFLAGVMTGVGEKLAAGERQSRSEGLVVHRDAAREAYLRQRYPRQSSRAAGTLTRTQAYEQGREAGRRIELQRPVGAAGAGPRLLPPRR
jgi:hypothetical protein